ncbi:MAG: nucleotidyltransferase family protein [Anaeroplasmataceae bacterium]|nr:nucleotidyltransferase family protein [Anaeroplasmataceae bacterium]
MNHPILTMLKAYFKKETLSIDIEEAQRLIPLAKEQSLQPFLYVVYPIKEFKKYYISAAIMQEDFLKLQREITLLFNQEEIPHVYFKGSVLNEIYPDSALRTRGDIDVYVDKKNFTKAKSIFIKNGFEILHIDSQHHIEFIKNNLMVELHFALFDIVRSSDYFKEPFSLCEKVEQNLYAFTEINHFIYCLHHFQNHLRLGAGIRYLLDFYYMLKTYHLDMDVLHSKIDQLGYKRLYQNIINSLYELTEEELDNVPKENVDFFLEYLLKSGIHGFGQESNRDNKGFAIKDNKLKAILLGTFMTEKSYRIAKYPTLGKHWFTYPLCLIHRIFYLLFTQTGKLFKLLFFKKNKISKEEKELRKNLGID